MPLRVGFFGGGFISGYHASMLKGSGADAVVAAVHDPDGAKALAFSEKTGAAAVATEDELLDTVDAVYVCTWTSEHVRLTEAAAARGLPIFCEKPLSVDLAGATRMVGAVKDADVVNQVGLVLRDSPAFLYLRHLLEGDVGRVMSVVFRDDQYLPVQGIYGSTWRADRGLAGGGTLIEHSIHDLDLIEWLFGGAVSLSARTAAFHGIDGIEDLAVVSLALASGAIVTLTSVWHDVLSRPSTRRMEVICERAVLVLEGDVFGPVHRVDSDGECSAENDGLMRELHDAGVHLRNPDGGFIEAVQHRTPAQPDFATALRPHVLADAAYRSAAAGGAWIDVGASGLPQLSE